jgi:hypothetical protein
MSRYLHSRSFPIHHSHNYTTIQRQIRRVYKPSKMAEECLHTLQVITFLFRAFSNALCFLYDNSSASWSNLQGRRVFWFWKHHLFVQWVQGIVRAELAAYHRPV